MSKNIPISQFLESDITATDTITFVRNGQNYKVPVSSLLTILGAIGDLESVGDDLGVPVLEQPAPLVNQIRKIIGGAGVEVGTSPMNGIQVDTNFLQGDNSGVQVLENPNTNPLVKSIRAQSGSTLTVSDAGDSIIIGSSETPVTNRTVVVNSIDDFPAPVDGVIELNDRVDYFIANDISTSNRFEVNSSVVIRAGASQIITLEYTGTGAMFTGVNPIFRMDRLTLSCPNGSLFDMSSPVSGSIIQIIESNVAECETIGIIDGAFILRFKGVAWENIKTNGLVCAGSNANLVIDTNLLFLNGGTFLDLNDAVFSNVIINNSIVQASVAGTTFVSGLPDSGNIIPGGLGTVLNCRILGDATPISGITSKDIRWELSLNDGIPNTTEVALVSLSINATPTPIASVDTPVKASGVWVVQNESFFECDTTGRSTFTGEKDSVNSITASFSLLGDSGGDKQASAYIAINGVAIAETGVQVTMNSSKAAAGTCVWEYDFKEGDYVELFVDNNQDTTDVIVNGVVRID